MMRTPTNVALFIILSVLIVCTWVLRRDYSERNSEFLPGMVNTQRYNDQSDNPNFADGKTLQTPPAGTLPKGIQPIHYVKTPEDVARAGAELVNPISDSSAVDSDRGAVVFTTFCQPCHGVSALGDGPVTKRGFPPPPSLLAAKALKLKDGEMFHVITYGQGNMPSLAPQISQIDRWWVIGYVRSLQRKTTEVGLK